MNSLYCEPIGGSPHFVLFGEEPRTGLSAQADWSTPCYGKLVGVETFTYEDMMSTVAEGHMQMRNIQGLAMLGSSVAQVLTKHAYDAAALPNTFKTGDVVALYLASTNKLEPHFTGPFVITKRQSGGNMATLGELYSPGAEEMRPVHVSRLIHFDISRASSGSVGAALVTSGYYIVKEVLEHRVVADGTVEVHLSWHDTPVQTWEPLANMTRITVTLR